MAQEEGGPGGRQTLTVALSAAGVKISKARDKSPCRSQVSERRVASSTLCFSSPDFGSDPVFSQGCPPRTQDKATHPPPASPSSLVKVPSSATGKRQTCDIEGTWWMSWGSERLGQWGWGPFRVASESLELRQGAGCHWAWNRKDGGWGVKGAGTGGHRPLVLGPGRQWPQ